jgi:outer membrane receptor for ferrienterochelin and colicin
MTYRAALAASAAFLGLCVGTPALAQVDQGNATQPQSAGTAGNDEEDVIIVTAQKRTENLQDVPLSISVIGGEDLVETGATQLTEMAGYVPGLHVGSLGAPGQTQISLRGIVPLAAGASVATYVDDAPVGSSTV